MVAQEKVESGQMEKEALSNRKGFVLYIRLLVQILKNEIWSKQLIISLSGKFYNMHIKFSNKVGTKECLPLYVRSYGKFASLAWGPIKEVPLAWLLTQQGRLQPWCRSSPKQ